jgi:hypothetical protein
VVTVVHFLIAALVAAVLTQSVVMLVLLQELLAMAVTAPPRLFPVHLLLMRVVEGVDRAILHY